MSTRVYGPEQSPAVDFRKFKCSNSSADSILAAGRAALVNDGKPGRAIQLFEVSPEKRQNIYERIHEGQWIGQEIPGVRFVPPERTEPPSHLRLILLGLTA